MKNKLLLGLFVGTILFSLAFNIFYSEKVSADATPAYSHETTLGYNQPDWMASLPGDRKLSTLSLPGTHDAMARYNGPNAEAQTLPLDIQLESGIRVLDIRCRNILNAFLIYHGETYQWAGFDDVLRPVTTFLQNHPKETVLLMIGKEGEDYHSDRTFAQTYQAYRNYDPYKSYFWIPNSTNPTLQEVRGKIVVLYNGSDFGPPDSAYRNEFHKDVGINFQNDNHRNPPLSDPMFIKAPDDYNIPTIWFLYRQWVYIKNQINAASAGNPERFYVNYLSGNGGVTPFFVASGHISAGTGDNNLSSGLLTSYCPSALDSIPLLRETCWADFPRKDCTFGTNCFIYYEGTNVLTYQRLANKHLRVGIILADFPGAGLIDRIIKQNNCSS